MIIRDDVPLSLQRKHGKYADLFGKIKHGQSIHADDLSEAQSIKMSFIGWARRRKIEMKPSFRLVDETDPDGAGYRVWFFSTSGDAK